MAGAFRRPGRASTGLFAVAVAVLVLIGAARQAAAQGTYFEHSSPDGVKSTRMWVPDGLRVVRGVVLFGNGAGGDDRALANKPRNQAFAEMHGFVVIATAQFGRLEPSEVSTWESHLQALADKSGHPELVHAPWVAMGHSNGGQMAWSWNAVYPEKTIGYVANKGGYYSYTALSEAAMGNPGILVAGETDEDYRLTAVRLLYTANRPRGALVCWVEEENIGHQWGDTMDLFLPFMAEAIRLRYPADQAPTATTGVELLPLSETAGWLVDQTTYKTGSTYIAPHAEYTGDDFDAGWVLNQQGAYHYRAFATYDKLISMSCSSTPDARYDVSKSLTLTVNTSNFQNWTKVEIFDGAVQIAEQIGDGSPRTSAVFNVTLGLGVHGLSAMATHADGRVSPSKIDTFTVVPPPSPVHAGSPQRIYFPGNAAELTGAIEGDEGPAPPAGWTAQWSTLSGPAEAEFDNPTLLATTARFSMTGFYVLRLTGTQAGGGSYCADVVVNVTYPPQPDGPHLAYGVTNLGSGLFGWTFRIVNNDGLLMPYTLSLGFQGTGGGVIQQIKSGGMAVNKEGWILWDEESQDWLGEGAIYCDQLDLAYDMARDTWVFNPFGDNAVPGINPLTGAPLNGIAQGANTYAISCYSGTGSALGSDVNAVYVVASGNVTWTGTILRNGQDVDVAGVTELPPLAGDFSGDGTVTHGDYTIWADTYGYDGTPGKEDMRADGNGDGRISHADYTIWADHFGDTIGGPLTISQPTLPAVTEAPVTRDEAMSPAAKRAARAVQRHQRRLERAAAHQQRRAARAPAGALQ